MCSSIKKRHNKLKLQLPNILRLDSRESPHLKRIVKEQYKAAFDKLYGGKPTRKIYQLGEASWAGRHKHYMDLRESYPLFDKSVLGLAGLVMSQGIYHKPAVNRKDETYALAEDAVFRADKFRDQRYINSKMFSTVVALGSVGSCFWEISDNDIFDFRIPTLQEYIEPASADGEGNITGWRQIIHGTTTAEWTSQQLKLISWNPTSSTWPYGNGLGVGLETELEALVQMETDSKDFMGKQAWPYEVLALGDNANPVSPTTLTEARSEWMQRKPGQGLVTDVPTNIIPGGTGSSPIRDLAALCTLMKDNVHDGLVVPPVLKLYNSTEASANVLVKHVMTILGQPLQWLLKEHYETDILKPFMIQQGFSVKACPMAMFESPDAYKKEEGDFWVSLVQNKIQSPIQACDHLGLEYDEAYWAEQERKQQEQMQQQLDAKASTSPFQKKEGSAPNDAKPEPKAKETWKVVRMPNDS